MSPESGVLQNLLTQFDVKGLGEGDPIAGCNLLAAMAVTLADLAPSDGSVVYPDGTPARLGASMLISGSLSSGRISDEVITEIGNRQANLEARFRRYCDWAREQSRRPSLTHPNMDPGHDAGDELLSQVLSELEPLHASRSEAWIRMLSAAPPEKVWDFADKPKFLVSAARPKDLAAQLVGLRPGRPIIHLGLNRTSDLGELAEPGAALVGGYYPAADSCGMVRGNVILTDPMRLLNGAAKAPDERTAWLGNFLWLTDGDAGPDVPADVADMPRGNAAIILERFRRAIGGVMAKRLDLWEKKPLILCHDPRVAAHRWTKFLGEMEERHPGISGAARNLTNSLVFGFGEIARAGKGLNVTMKEVMAFARFIVRRAVNARTAICHAADVAKRRSQIERIFRKLQGGGWHEERRIYGDLGIPAADCRESLMWLQGAGIALCKDRQWRLAEGAQLNFNDSRMPLLEV